MYSTCMSANWTWPVHVLLLVRFERLKLLLGFVLSLERLRSDMTGVFELLELCNATRLLGAGDFGVRSLFAFPMCSMA